ncbi:LacI family DNA-binding transcriptional regulator [Brachybacterium alimentarium]|uniref:LacI family DNA-binding transcriptional regulator n=1 Tax=Brachybacterium alimentarium TaxID=47845 RepID=UPI003FD6B366
MTPRPSPGRRPTMRDVAREAEVSTALVSIVFRGAPGASDETRERVLEVAHRIGYVRDERARLLRARRSMDIGVCFETQQAFHHQLLDVLYSALEPTDHSIVLSAVSPSRGERAALHGLVAYRCGAIITLGSSLPAQDLHETASGTPLVVATRGMGTDFDWVASDDEQGLVLAVEHLVELGHREIVFATAAGAAGADERGRGFATAVEATGVSSALREGGSTEESGAELALAFLESGALPSAIIAFNDRSALGMLDVFVRHGIRVPEDVSVVGYDDSEIASRSYVQLTTIAQDTQTIGSSAAEIAVSRIAEGVVGPPSASGAPSAHGPSSTRSRASDNGGDAPGVRSSAVTGRRVPTSLVVRETTGPPRSARRAG